MTLGIIFAVYIAGFVLVMGCYMTAHMIHDILTFFSDYED